MPPPFVAETVAGFRNLWIFYRFFRVITECCRYSFNTRRATVKKIVLPGMCFPVRAVVLPCAPTTALEGLCILSMIYYFLRVW